jgi:hypothetical protein
LNVADDATVNCCIQITVIAPASALRAPSSARPMTESLDVLIIREP